MLLHRFTESFSSNFAVAFRFLLDLSSRRVPRFNHPVVSAFEDWPCFALHVTLPTITVVLKLERRVCAGLLVVHRCCSSGLPDLEDDC